MKLKFDPMPELPPIVKLYRIVNNRRRYEDRFQDIRQLVNHLHREYLDNIVCGLSVDPKPKYWVNLWNALRGKL